MLSWVNHASRFPVNRCQNNVVNWTSKFRIRHSLNICISRYEKQIDGLISVFTETVTAGSKLSQSSVTHPYLDARQRLNDLDKERTQERNSSGQERFWKII